MRILHTADWHMNSVLGRQNLSALIVRSLEKIAFYLDEYAVDVLVVAGDLFSERSRDEGMREAIAQIRRVFGRFVARGGKIVAVAGNHDSELRFETLRDALQLGAGEGEVGSFLLTANPGFLALEARGASVQFALLPYPTPRCYLAPGVAFASLEEKNRLVQEGFAGALQRIRRELDPARPAVLVSHVHVRGAQGHSLYKVSESDDVVFEPSQIPTEWVYAAYGHIHKPGEAVAGAPHVRYSGSVVPLDAAERFDRKSVVLLEVGPRGERQQQLLALPPVALHQITLDCVAHSPEAELARWRDQIPDASEALIHYTVRYAPQTHSLAALRGAIERVFPRWYGRSDEKVGVELAPRPLDLPDLTPARAHPNPLSGDVPSLVRDYLSRRLQPSADRAAVLQLAEELLAATPR